MQKKKYEPSFFNLRLQIAVMSSSSNGLVVLGNESPILSYSTPMFRGCVADSNQPRTPGLGLYWFFPSYFVHQSEFFIRKLVVMLGVLFLIGRSLTWPYTLCACVVLDKKIGAQKLGIFYSLV